MFIILLGIWFILNGRFTLEITLYGIVMCSVVYFFLCKLTDFSFEKDKKFCKKFLLIIVYLGVLLKEIFLSNINIVKIILSPKIDTKPEIVHLHLGIKSKFFNTLIANSITLTPGTITVDLIDDHFVVYCLNRDIIDGFENSSLVQLVRKLEA